jgi:peptidoglycan/LPS O-acetylase OafA/YrhL
VLLFFMISGFVIYFTLERSATWRDFAFSRVSRLYPTYWAALTLMVVLEFVVFGKRVWLGGYVVNLTMLQEFLGWGNLDNVFWSLTVELAFYVIMGLLFAAGLLPRIEAVGAIWLALACLWSWVEQYLGIPLPAMLSQVLILRYAPFFVAGITFYRIARNGPTAARLALVLAALAAAAMIDGLWTHEVPTVEWPAIVRRLGVAVVLFGTFTLAITGRLRFSISPVTVWLGAISYSLYLTHRNLGYIDTPRAARCRRPGMAQLPGHARRSPGPRGRADLRRRAAQPARPAAVVPDAPAGGGRAVLMAARGRVLSFRDAR